MIGPAAPDDLDRLVELIELNTGNVIPRGQLPHLEQVASERAREAGFAGLGPYVELLGKSALQQEWRRLLPDVTIKESFLYRIPEHFEALRHDILPSLAKARPKTHGLRVWSAGCARGEEPATLAVVMAECPYLAGREWEVLATDVDDEALDCARRGEHGARAVAQVPAHLLRLHFEPRGAGFRLRRELLERIDFRHFNFFRSPYLGLGPPFDVIFLRNVLIYFSPDAQRRVVARVVSRLAPDGYLFLGHSESLINVSTAFEIVHLREDLVYRRPESAQKPTRRET
jgi:chemotaxis protein methyltransferase CheR